MITDIKQLDLNKRYTYADYLTWQFEGMVELIKGKIIKMSPAPTVAHQKLLTNFLLEIGNHFKGNHCQILPAPFDVRLPLPSSDQDSERIDTVVQPDISVICDPSKLDEQGCNGAPDWIIEILSPSTAKKDLNDKYELYQHAGVREYWIVHPKDQTVLTFILNNDGTYEPSKPTPYTIGETIKVGIFPDLVIDLDKVFLK